MPKNSDPSKTNANKVRKQNQLSQQGQSAMNEEFSSETDVNEVKKQNQQSQNKMRNSSGQSMNRYENGSK